MVEYEVVVIGGGAAGLSAATVLARARRLVVVIDAGSPRNGPARHLHGYLSRDGMDPARLLTVGRAELAAYGGELRCARVRSIERCAGGFEVRCEGAADVTARAVVVATGLRDELPPIPGVRERWGADVVHCPYCHGYEVRDRPIGVLGGENRPFTLHQAALVRQWSADVLFFPDRIVLTGEERARLDARGVRIVDGAVARLVGEGGRLHGVELADGSVVPRSTVFVGPRFIPRDRLLTALGCQVGEGGWVRVDGAGRTSVDGVWAVGNVADSAAQVIGAAAGGSRAGIDVNHYLLEREVRLAMGELSEAGR
ncbi:NAD(P)/FAD-dependent oxidoreductase [Nocardia sp. CDC159]|uniref:NAD(P)/FAD-dependent oxidoreductase n=1 Tax=Nocardia pulmonis TaxID=2951408 RepID=A0A9X2ECG8_9NOCA|nr:MULTISPECIES: NAD(P)/FAD-dependent oxidoreductase [Nocardia]MCM6778362.1 NAD(P)/FAD-dependent oxidoreductase [Nocardia pulmonis]MCM6791242.1 NAD(P)/FAD-dependent oxidoreductase [Nocardia sp. CDC159]